ncbi:hypothetical protein ABIA38_006970 [Embleya sp. AB8]
MQVVGPSELSAVRERAAMWIDRVRGLDYRNAWLYHTSRQSRLSLEDAEPEHLMRLRAGSEKPISLRTLFPEEARYQRAAEVARLLARRAKTTHSETGVETLHLASGLATIMIPVSAGQKPRPALCAPLLVRAVRLSRGRGAAADFELTSAEHPFFNPVLPYALAREFGPKVRPESWLTGIDATIRDQRDLQGQVASAHEALTELLSRWRCVPSVESATFIGVFNYEYQAMVADLENATDLMAGHDVLAAMAGHQGAWDRLHDGAAVTAWMPGADDVDPVDEYLVHDADSSQTRAINLVICGQHTLIDGPPGTGKSQTIANVIASLAARGKSVLFVAAKKVAIEAVTERLADIDLGDLVLDLHGSGSDRRGITQRLNEAFERAGTRAPVDVQRLHQALKAARSETNRHCEALHRTWEFWGLSLYDVMAELLPLREEGAHVVRIDQAVLRRLPSDRMNELASRLARFVAHGGLAIVRGEGPWARARMKTPGDVDQVLSDLDAALELLPLTRRKIRETVSIAGLREPAELTDWEDLFELLKRVEQTYARWGRGIFQEQLQELWYACADRTARAGRACPEAARGFVRRYRLRARARALRQDDVRHRSRLCDEIAQVITCGQHWAQWSRDGGRPDTVDGLESLMSDFAKLYRRLGAIAAQTSVDPERVRTSPPALLNGWLGQLDADRDLVDQLPVVLTLWADLKVAGLGGFVADLADLDLDLDRRISGREAARTLKTGWLTALMRHMLSEEPNLAEFVGEEHSEVVDRFRTADQLHLDRNAARVQRVVAENLRQAMDEHRTQWRRLHGQLQGRNRVPPFRTLITESPDVLLALHPCLAMSPLMVSQLLPSEQLFDVVIFDEASQVQPHHAITSIMRGRQLVVAGDDQQLPPTDYFQRAFEDREEEYEDVDDRIEYESLLGAVKALLPHQAHQRLRWHYRSRDERLIAFSNVEFYREELITFPGTVQGKPIRLEVVDGTAVPGQKGSTPEEIQRVVDLVCEHAPATAPKSPCASSLWGSRTQTASTWRSATHVEAIRSSTPSWPERCRLGTSSSSMRSKLSRVTNATLSSSVSGTPSRPTAG